MLHSIKSVCISSILFFTTIVAQGQADKILGKWKTQKGDAQAILECKKVQDGTYSFRIIHLDEPLDINHNPKTDKNNPDKTLRTRAIIGMEIIKGLRYEGSIWKGATIYNPNKGISATCEISLLDANTIKLKATKLFLSLTKTWKRAS